MARISIYGTVLPEDNDLLLGTDVQGGNATKNFLISEISALTTSNYLKTISWKFITTISNVGKSSMFFPAGSGDGTLFTNITSIVVNATMFNDTNSLPFLEYLKSDTISLFNRSDLGSFGVYKLDDVQPYANTGGADTLYLLSLTSIEGAGSVAQGGLYGLQSEPLNSASDKTEVFTQTTPALTWVINHSLLKFPSVTVVDTAKTTVIGSVAYNSNSKITLTVSAAFAGEAYLN